LLKTRKEGIKSWLMSQRISFAWKWKRRDWWWTFPVLLSEELRTTLMHIKIIAGRSMLPRPRPAMLRSYLAMFLRGNSRSHRQLPKQWSPVSRPSEYLKMETNTNEVS
jgi:hypothetical protein